MKDLTEKEFFEAPNKVQYIYMMGMMKRAIGSGVYEDAIKEHPEYFPDEVEHTRKWDAIPQDVHDKYWEEYWKLDKEIMKDVPPSKGIFGWIDEQEGLYRLEKFNKDMSSFCKENNIKLPNTSRPYITAEYIKTHIDTVSKALEKHYNSKQT